MREGVELFVHRVDHCRVAVADVHDTDPAREIDVLAAVHVPEASAFGAGHEERVRRGYAARDGAGAALQQVAGSGHMLS